MYYIATRVTISEAGTIKCFTQPFDQPSTTGSIFETLTANGPQLRKVRGDCNQGNFPTHTKGYRPKVW